jgi:hypothetical protein
MPDTAPDPRPEDVSREGTTRITRREFHRRAACAAAGLLLAASTGAEVHASDQVSATEKTPDPGSQAPPAPPPSTAADTGKEAVPSAPKPEGLEEAVARVRAAAPSLPEGDMEELEAQVKSALDLSKALHEAHVADGTEPDFVYRALTPTPTPTLNRKAGK